MNEYDILYASSATLTTVDVPMRYGAVHSFIQNLYGYMCGANPTSPTCDTHRVYERRARMVQIIYNTINRSIPQATVLLLLFPLLCMSCYISQRLLFALSLLKNGARFFFPSSFTGCAATSVAPLNSLSSALICVP